MPLAYLRAAAAPGGGGALARGVEAEGPAGIMEDLPRPVDMDWDSIVARDTLSAVLTFNSTGYFIHRGEPMGFEYEMLEAFAEDHDLALRTVVARSRADLFRMLNRGEGDVVAARLTLNPEYERVVALTRPLYSTAPVVVQRTTDVEGEAGAPTGPDTAVDVEGGVGETPGADTAIVDAPGDPIQVPPPMELQARLLRRPSELAGDTVHVPSASDYYTRITELSDSLGQDIELVEVAQADQVEPLIEAVAEGRIRLTVSPQNLAELSQTRFTNIVVTPVVGPEQPVVWAVRENALGLKRQLDAWLADPERRELRQQLYIKYFVDQKGYQQRTEDPYMASETGQISPYDSLLAREAAGLGWDWRLLAAQVAQESRFDPRARSWAGARGLLQLMPRTAREMGVSNPTNPEENVQGGVRYLQWLSGLWQDEIADEDERRKFILASYNAGRGHVLDAQRLAAKHGDDPTKWEDVAYWLLQKSKPAVYRDEVVQHGYVRGVEPVQYVSKILKRYESYRSVR